jgi:KDO2-lipid IV(A) lauroyltransferase
MTELTNNVIYQILCTMVKLLGLLPRGVGLSVGKGLGLTAYVLDRRHRRIALRNLAMAMPGVPGKARIAREVFVNLGLLVADFIYFHGGGPDRFRAFVSISGLSHYQSAKEKGRGVLCLTAHFGNWELLALSFSVLVSPVWIIMRPLDFEPLNRVVASLRTSRGNRLIPKKAAVKSSIRALKRGETIGVLNDQKDSWRLGVYVEFFGQPASANKGMALMALRTGASVVPVFIIRKKDYRYEIVFEPEMALIRTGDMTRDVEENTALFARVIERYVRKYPGQWLWAHNRWEKKPYEVWPRKS